MEFSALFISLTEHPRPDNVFDAIPSSTPIGVIATPRGNGYDNDIYVLWQDNTTDIQVRWTDDYSSWKGPSTYPALQGGDAGTAIACLNTATDSNSSMPDVPDMCKCYFQVKGAVREVSCANRQWSVVGTVPIS